MEGTRSKTDDLYRKSPKISEDLNADDSDVEDTDSDDENAPVERQHHFSNMLSESVNKGRRRLWSYEDDRGGIP
jgi:hypothetical protein